jgi:deoxyadenosine/deoxycytidine kinase
MEHRVYIALTSAWRDIIGSRELDLIIWLDTPLDETQRRIKKRGRVDENDLPEPYLIALIQSHRANFDGGLYSGVPVLTIDGSQPFHTDEHIVVDIAQSVLRKVVGKKGSVKP